MAQTEAPEVKSDRIDTGWTVVARNPAMVRLIDRVVGMRPCDSFTVAELAEFADVRPDHAAEQIDRLVQMGVLDPDEDASPTAYRCDPDSEVYRALVELDGAVIRQGPHYDS